MNSCLCTNTFAWFNMPKPEPSLIIPGSSNMLSNIFDNVWCQVITVIGTSGHINCQTYHLVLGKRIPCRTTSSTRNFQGTTLTSRTWVVSPVMILMDVCFKSFKRRVPILQLYSLDQEIKLQYSKTLYWILFFHQSIIWQINKLPKFS